MQVVEALPLPAALELVSACCGQDLRESDVAAVKVSYVSRLRLYMASFPSPNLIAITHLHSPPIAITHPSPLALEPE